MKNKLNVIIMVFHLIVQAQQLFHFPMRICCDFSYDNNIILGLQMHIHPLAPSHSSHKAALFCSRKHLYKTILISAKVFPKFLFP